jgi:hypothetical protein
MIVKLHGTSGAGKSTVAWTFLKAGVPEPLRNARGKPEAYLVSPPDWSRKLYILGKYETQCGGCDTLNADEQIELLHKYAPLGHVLYEGLLASEYYGRLGVASEKYGDDHIFAFLDTPIDLCIERIKQRRLLAGNTKPLNEENTRGRIKKIESLQRKLVAMNRRVVGIAHESAYIQVFNLFGESRV